MSHKKQKLKESDLQGFKYFKKLAPLLERLHQVACERDKAHNRLLHMDQYLTLLLLCMFSPICSSLRAMQQASELKKVQRKLKVPRAALGSLSEASRVFDSHLLLEAIGQLADQIRPLTAQSRLSDLNAILTIVDGTVLSALPQTVRAFWMDQNHRGYKAHVHYEPFSGIPSRMRITDPKTSEISVLTDQLEAGRLYVLDRGYAKYQLLQDIIDAESHFICRIKTYYHVQTVQENPVCSLARDSGVLKDHHVALGHHPRYKKLHAPVRLLEVACTERSEKSVRMMRQTGRKETTMWIVTDRFDLPAETIALLYRYRWQVEIFFRWFKHILGCRHLLSHCENGIELQMYAGILACLLISLYTGCRATKRTYEMFCWYLSGWADEEDLLNHIEKLQPSL